MSLSIRSNHLFHPEPGQLFLNCHIEPAPGSQVIEIMFLDKGNWSDEYPTVQAIARMINFSAHENFTCGALGTKLAYGAYEPESSDKKNWPPTMFFNQLLDKKTLGAFKKLWEAGEEDFRGWAKRVITMPIQDSDKGLLAELLNE